MNPNKRHSTRTGGGIVLALGLLAGLQGHAAPHPGAPPRLADLLRVDALGYECIAESDLEAAFLATAKPFHLPRTCLPDPCARRLTRPELAEIIGRPPTEALWEEYVARQAQACEDPAAFPEPPATTRVTAKAPARMTATNRDAAAFWAPLIGSGADGSARTLNRLPGGFESGGPTFRRAGRPWAGWPGHWAGRRVTDDLGHGPPPVPPAPEQPATVPLPPAFPLLLAGVLALGWRRARR